MVLSTQIVRVADGLPLAASMDDEEHSNGKELAEPKNLLRQLYKKLNNSVDQRCSIDTGNFIFHYYIEYGVCFLAICDKQYPKKLAFQFLEELQKEFNEKYGSEVGSVARPYAFVKFDTFIQKTKKQYKDTRTTKNLNKLHEDLRDVTGIMTMNIRDALVRGETLD
ncbi:Vesicle-trafficking protein S22b, partial [Clydaea vesicula]